MRCSNNTRTLMIEAAVAPCPVYYLYFYFPSSGGEGTTLLQHINSKSSETFAVVSKFILELYSDMHMPLNISDKQSISYVMFTQ